MSISSISVNCHHTFHLFEKPLCKQQDLIDRVMNVAFHILTLGIPLAIYHIIKCTYPRSENTIEDPLPRAAVNSFKNVKKRTRPNDDPMPQPRAKKAAPFEAFTRVTNLSDDPIQQPRTQRAASIQVFSATEANQKLIEAVVGIKRAAAILAGLFSPIIGLMIWAYDAPEGPKDLVNIDRALAQGANIDYQETHFGYTPLIYAAYYGYPDIAQHLLDRGANPDIKEHKGYNACMMANYYLKQYQGLLRSNEMQELSPAFTVREQAKMGEKYQDYIERYQRLVDILQPVTHEPIKQAGWFF